jgi:hypothetical protein
VLHVCHGLLLMSAGVLTDSVVFTARPFASEQADASCCREVCVFIMWVATLYACESDAACY